MRELGFDVLRVETVLVEDGTGEVAETMASLPTFVAQASQSHQKHGITAGFGRVATTRE
ncbi:hypothetical protein D3C85_1525680 [compost metagenome]